MITSHLSVLDSDSFTQRVLDCGSFMLNGLDTGILAHEFIICQIV